LFIDSFFRSTELVYKTAVFNLKGGVGKSTTAYNLAVGLTKFHQKRVLLVDIDPQGNSAAALGIPIWELQKQLKDALVGLMPLQSVILPTASGVDVVPSNLTLAEEEIPITGRPGRELLLRKVLAPVADAYDFVIIDCPPNIGVFSINALMSADSVLVPVDMSYLGLLGLSSIERALTLVREQLEHPISILGVLANRYDGRNNLSKEVHASLKEHFPELLFNTVIPETVKLREAPSFARTIYEHEPAGTAALAYRNLTQEVIDRAHR
jgi:chromosome partitioning protein